MKFSFDAEGKLLLKCENDMENFALRSWVKNGDGIVLHLLTEKETEYEEIELKTEEID